MINTKENVDLVSMTTCGLTHFSDYPEWPLLLKEFAHLKHQTIQQLFLEDPSRKTSFSVEAAGLQLDYAFQCINQEALFLLSELAKRYGLKQHIENLFNGEKKNYTEARPALHTALRAAPSEVIQVNGENVNLAIQSTLEQMESIAFQLQNQLWLGFKATPITDVVNLGIGGSDLGPKMAVHALKKYHNSQVSCHFISDSDPDSFEDVIKGLNPATTLFIVASKSFTTKETLLNFQRAKTWLGDGNPLRNHFIAITAYPERAIALNIHTVLPIWEWVGGRFSFFSAINLILMIAIGSQSFHQLLQGSREMDTHFRTAPLACNMPVLLAFLGIWNQNFFHANNHVLLVYSSRLSHFVSYLQQLDMESNGKSVNASGTKVDYTTGPIVWGGIGNQAEHAFYQLLYQGTHFTPGDCLLIGEKPYQPMNQIALDRLNTLIFGINDTENHTAFIPQRAGMNKILINELNPQTLGALISLYEHKIYCQSVMWNINAFDQPGIEAAKRCTQMENMIL